MGVSLTERIAATNPAKPRTVTVKVSLDADLSEQREALEAELAAAKNDTDRRQGQPDPTADIQERIAELEKNENGQVLRLKFTRLPGTEWTELATRFPARPDVKLDLALGVNLPKVCIAAAERNGVIVEDDGTETEIVRRAAVRDENNKIVAPAVDEWADLWAVLAGYDVNNIIDAIWELNVSIPAGRVARLGKA